MRHGKSGFAPNLGIAPSPLVRCVKKFASHSVSLVCVLTVATASVAPVQADEFSTIPQSHEIYKSLKVLRQGPWGGEPGAANHSLTRYEVAIEAAKAILRLNAQRS